LEDVESDQAPGRGEDEAQEVRSGVKEFWVLAIKRVFNCAIKRCVIKVSAIKVSTVKAGAGSLQTVRSG
jgi:hypothetical protein